jgi:hypothetical protein
LDNNELSDNSARINAYLEKLGYRKYFIDNHGNLSDIEVNTERRNYIFTTNALLSTK